MKNHEIQNVIDTDSIDAIIGDAKSLVADTTATLTKSFRGLGAIGWLFAGVAIGGLATFFFDPVSGKRRIGYVRDKGFHYGKSTVAHTGRQLRRLSHRAQGLAAKASTWKNPAEQVDDRVLENRIRSEIGHITRHARPIIIEAEHGEVTLSGPVLAADIDAVLSKVRSIPGVKKVFNVFEVFESAEHIPSLQGS